VGRSVVSDLSAERDVNEILWERVTADQQAGEITQTRPSTSYQPK
jgi:hypothetical protein